MATLVKSPPRTKTFKFEQMFEEWYKLVAPNERKMWLCEEGLRELFCFPRDTPYIWLTVSPTRTCKDSVRVRRVSFFGDIGICAVSDPNNATYSAVLNREWKRLGYKKYAYLTLQYE